MAGRTSAATEEAVREYRRLLAMYPVGAAKLDRNLAFNAAVQKTGVHRTTLWRALRAAARKRKLRARKGRRG